MAAQTIKYLTVLAMEPALPVLRLGNFRVADGRCGNTQVVIYAAHCIHWLEVKLVRKVENRLA